MSDKDWLGRAISGFALAVSVVSAAFSALTYLSGQEDLAIIVRRDWRSAIEKEPLSAAYIDFEDREGIKVRWLVQVTNTSTSATLSITDMEATTWQFTGASMPAKPPAWMMRDTGTFLRVEDHKPVVFPLRLVAGETVGLEVFPVFSVKKGVAAQFSAGQVEREPGVFTLPAIRTHDGAEQDYFGNIARVFPDDKFSSREPSMVKQPRLEVNVTTGRGRNYSASGNWYRRVYREVK